MPIKLIGPTKRSSNYRARGTYLPRTEHAFYIDRSLGTAERKEAETLFAELLADIKGGRVSRKTVEPKERDFVSAARDYVIAGGEKRFIEKLATHFGVGFPLSKIDQAVTDAAALKLCPMSTPATRNRQVYSPISAILRREGIKIGLRRPKGAQGASRLHWLQPEQVFALTEAATALNPRFGALLTFLAYCGPRLSEALRLEWADVDLAASHAFLRRTKNGSAQGVHLPPNVVAELANLPRQGLRVFGFSKSSRLYDFLNKAEAASGVTIPPGISFHIFRHSYGAWMRRYGGLDTAGLVGTGRWKSRQAAAVYEHVDTTEEARRADLLPTRRSSKA